MEKSAVTLETLKRGAIELGIKVPTGITHRALEKQIERELAKDKTHGSYACEACGRDIIDDIIICPFCSAIFQDSAPDEPEETPQFDDEVKEFEPDPDLLYTPREDELTYDENTKREKPPIQPPKKRPGRPKSNSSARKSGPTSPQLSPRQLKTREKERELRRQQIREELPYDRTQLRIMKRSTLVMIASILKIPSPVKLGAPENIINAITKVQRDKWPGQFSDE